MKKLILFLALIVALLTPTIAEAKRTIYPPDYCTGLDGRKADICPKGGR